jgi:hypothetical protein
MAPVFFNMGRHRLSDQARWGAKKMKYALTAGVLAITLSGCAPEGPQANAPMTPCQSAASVVGNPYATPGAVEMALEFMRVKCLGMTADGSRQLRPAPVASRPSTDAGT